MMRSAIADLAPAMDAFKTVGDYLSKNETQIAAMGTTISELNRALNSPSMLDLASAQRQAFQSRVHLAGLQSRTLFAAVNALSTPSFLEAISARNEALIASLNFAGLAAPALANMGKVFRNFDARQRLFDARLEAVMNGISAGAIEWLETPVSGEEKVYASDALLDECELEGHPAAVPSVEVDAGHRSWPKVSPIPVSVLFTLLSALLLALAYSSKKYIPEDLQVDMRTLAVGALLLIIGAALINK